MEAAPRIYKVSLTQPDLRAIGEAAAALRRGELVIFPTETVYGLGADATNPEALARLNAVKGRPPEKPYSWHLASAAAVRQLVPQIPEAAARLMRRYWPGPLTIIVPAGGRTIGFRVPDHPVAQAFLAACEVPVAAPSANRSGAQPPTTAEAALAGIGSGAAYLLDSGPTAVGRESTVVEVLQERILIRREGAIPAAEVLAVAGVR